MDNFQLSKRATQIIIEPLDPAVQQALEGVRKVHPQLLKNVTKIIVHQGGGGELGHVSNKAGEIPTEIHLYKGRILELVKSQLGAKTSDPKALAEATKTAIMEVISHEAGHLKPNVVNESQPFFGEGEAEAKAKEVMQKEKLLHPKPAHTNFLLSKRAAIEMACPHCKEDVSQLKPEKTPAGLYKMLTCPKCKEGFYPQDALVAVKEQPERKRDIGNWIERGWWAIWFDGMILGYTNNESNANQIKRRIVSMVEDGDFNRVPYFKNLIINEFSILDSALYNNVDKKINNLRGGLHKDFRDLFLGDGDKKTRKNMAEKSIMIKKLPQAGDAPENKDSIISGAYPTEENRKASYEDFQRYGYDGTIEESTEQTENAIGELTDRLKEKVQKQIKIIEEGKDPSKMNDDRKYSFINAPLSKRSKKKRFDIIKTYSHLSKRAMKITKDMIPTLWYENEEGEKCMFDNGTTPPKGFIYQHSQFPLTLNHQILRAVVTDEVKSCPHHEKDVKPTGGWIDGVEGRECVNCNGTQTRNTSEQWPDKWDAHGSRDIMTGSSSYPQDLVLAMANSNDWDLSEAIIIAANSCERCMNALAEKYGLKWGYKEFGEEWQKCNTSCEFCKSDPKSKKFDKPKKGFRDILLQAALTLDAIREKYLPFAPMAEPNLRFAIKALNPTQNLIKIGLELLKDKELHPISEDIENAIDFNKTAVWNPNVARLLGTISNELNLANFGTPDFITDLAEWQEKNSLEPNGKLDSKTIKHFSELNPKLGELPRNFGTVIPGLVYRGAIVEKLEQLENLVKNYNIKRVISLHDSNTMAKMCDLLKIEYVPIIMTNGNPDVLKNAFGDSVLNFIGTTPTYIHCLFGADRAGAVIARIRTESHWSCFLAYAEAKSYGFKDMFADLIDWFSEPCEKKLNIDTDAIRKQMNNKPPEISQSLVEPAPTDMPFETSNSGYETTSDTIVNTFGICSVPLSEGSHGW